MRMLAFANFLRSDGILKDDDNGHDDDQDDDDDDTLGDVFLS